LGAPKVRGAGASLFFWLALISPIFLFFTLYRRIKDLEQKNNWLMIKRVAARLA
jgi:hypothetical protein